MLDNLFYSLLSATSGSDGNIVDSAISPQAREAVTIAFMIMMVLAAIAMIVIVLMQKGTNDNVGVITGASDTYYGRNKAKGKEGTLKKVTFGLFAFLLVCSVICFVVGAIE